MPRIEQPPASVQGLTGLHLYQFPGSNCSQRVRLTLEEKGLAWTAHTLDAAAHEHLQPDYAAINPNRVVPTLVHDGAVHVESADIIQYLDAAFPDPPLMPADREAQDRCRRLIAAAAAFQDVIKTLSYHLVFRGKRTVTPDDLKLFERVGLDAARIAFMRDYADGGAAWQARATAAEAAAQTSLDQLNRILGSQSWLSGSAYGLADIAWVVNVERLKLCRIAFDPFPHVAAWHAAIAGRPGYVRAVSDYRG